MTIVPMMPFDTGKNLGRAYNEAMDLIPNHAWACLLDHDMMFTTRDWFPQLERAIACRPDAGAFTAVTNRIGAFWQKAKEADFDNHDIRYHRAIGAKRLEVKTLLDVSGTKGFGGVLTLVSKRAWLEVGGFVDGLLCVDHGLHFGLRKVGRKVFLIEGLYVYHWRRAFGDELPKDTPRAENCPCRGPEIAPTERIVIS